MQQCPGKEMELDERQNKELERNMKSLQKSLAIVSASSSVPVGLFLFFLQYITIYNRCSGDGLIHFTITLR